MNALASSRPRVGAIHLHNVTADAVRIDDVMASAPSRFYASVNVGDSLTLFVAGHGRGEVIDKVGAIGATLTAWADDAAVAS